MGQAVAVFEKPTTTQGVVRFELNRSLTGSGHERYESPADCTRDRPPDVLARRLFERGGVKKVHIFSNVVTVTLEAGADSDGILDIIRNLYIHYLPGVTPSLP